MKDKAGDLCSLKAVRKVHEVNRHKGKEQLITAYRKAEWMSPARHQRPGICPESLPACQKDSVCECVSDDFVKYVF